MSLKAIVTTDGQQVACIRSVGRVYKLLEGTSCDLNYLSEVGL